MGTVDMVRIPATLGVMIWLSPKLTLVTMIPLPFVSLLAYGFIRYMNKQSKVVQELFSTMSSRMQENLAGSRVVKAYGIADRESRSFFRDADDYMRANIKLVSIMSGALPLVAVLVGIFVIIIMGQGGTMVIRGDLSLGNLTSFIICMVMLAFPLAQLGYVLTLYQRGAVSMARIGTIMAEPVEDRGGAEDIEIEGAITFENVGFSYEVFAMRDKRKRKSEADRQEKRDQPIATTEVLKDLSFEIAPGQTVALVGPTGSGKSTLAGLITRAYDPTKGRIRVDGRDLKSIPLAALRAALGFVPQDPFAFSDSIRENLLLARPDATEDEVRAACDVAQLSEALERFPRGLDTLLGERGINLSGGQKQRLTLARAILRDPTVLVLDDALSSVDTHTEERILTGLQRVLADRTALIISHRVSTLRYADQILVLGEAPDGGYTITERGNHDALMSLDGAYAELYRRQLLEDAMEDDIAAEGERA
jgi:ATP-binding cassette subfamily B protein